MRRTSRMRISGFYHLFFLLIVSFPVVTMAGTARKAALNTDHKAHPEVHQTRILDLDLQSVSGRKVMMAYLSGGRVLRLLEDGLSASQMAFLKETKQSGQLVRIEYEEKDERTDKLLSLLPVDEEHAEDVPLSAFIASDDSSFNGDTFNRTHGYRTLQTMTPAAIFAYFKSKNLKKSAECFHRAYVWAYDLWVEKGIESRKVFAFFTKNFVRRRQFKWWFHVAPSVVDQGQEIVLDATYTTGPRTVQGWLQETTGVRLQCPVIGAYRGADAHNVHGDCFLRKTNMYYYGPSRIAAADRKLQTITRFEPWALRNSERQARP